MGRAPLIGPPCAGCRPLPARLRTCAWRPCAWVAALARGLVVALLLGRMSQAWAAGGNYVTPRQADGLRIRSIEFHYLGDRPLKSHQLRGAMRLQEGKRFRYRYFRGDLASVVALYRARGYREASVTRRQLLVDGRGRLLVRLDVASGPRWHVSQVRIQADSTLDTTVLYRQLRVRAGDPLDYGRVLQDERDLQIFLNSRGYAQARVSDQWVDDAATHTSQVVYRVHAGRRMYFGSITLVDAERLKTRPELIRHYLTFHPGDLFDPRELSRSRRLLSRTGLFRSVFFITPRISTQDSLQPIQVRVEERKYIQLSANAYARVSAHQLRRRVSASIEDGNWLGRGHRLGTEMSLGQPLQGGSVYFMERNVLSSGADLVLSTGLTEEWGSTRVPADADDPRQWDLLMGRDPRLQQILRSQGEDAARRYLAGLVYDYTSIARVFKLSGSVTRSWRDRYQARFTVDYKGARNYPDPEESISYSGGTIPVDHAWKHLLTDRSQSVNLSAEFLRDSRDDRIAPSRGTFLRGSWLCAIKLGGALTEVLDGVAEARHYEPLSRHWVVAVAGQYTQTASLRSDRALPQVYWKTYGGEGSLRGVERGAITAVGGGRAGLNLRGELRFQSGRLGLVAFLDRAQVWRHAGQIRIGDLVRPSGMVDGYGMGARWVIGFPFRLDVAFNDGFDRRDRMRIYFSIGQAF